MHTPLMNILHMHILLRTHFTGPQHRKQKIRFNFCLCCIGAGLLFTACQPASKSTKEETVLQAENTTPKKENEQLRQEKPDLSGHAPAAHATAAGSLSFLEGLKGKYPHQIKLFDNEVLRPRLRKMLGSEYDFMIHVWEVETPIEIENGLLYAWGMQAHSGGDPGAVLMADLRKDVLYVAIRKDARVKVYSEDGSAVPQRLQDWADE